MWAVAWLDLPRSSIGNTLDTDAFRNARPASLLLGAAFVGLAAHVAHDLLSEPGGGEVASDWTFYGLALLVHGSGRCARRAGTR